MSDPDWTSFGSGGFTPRFHGELYRRKDRRWAWRVVAANGKIVAVDGGQGYERRIDAVGIFEALYPDLELRRGPNS